MQTVCSKLITSLITLALSLGVAAMTACGGSPSAPKAEAASRAAPPATTQAEAPSSPAPSSPPSNPTPAPPSPAPPSQPPTFAQIQDMAGWSWCTAKRNGAPCASGRGNATSSLAPKQADPSLSGASAAFTLGGNTPYSNALWWKTLSTDTSPTHFTYDLNFMIDNPGAAQALEFDTNQAIGANRYTWGTECNYRGTGKWDIWNDETEQWEATSVPCPEVSANQWHHLTWQFERVGTQVHYISVTLDGKTSKVDAYRNYQTGVGGNGYDVALQLDGDFQQSPYKVWLDKVNLTAW
ncbi:MAG: hypothetical protein ABI383_01360 [Acidobacteriaceae bacterium]